MQPMVLSWSQRSYEYDSSMAELKSWWLAVPATRALATSCALVSNERISASSLIDSHVPWPEQSLAHAAREHAVPV